MNKLLLYFAAMLCFTVGVNAQVTTTFNATGTTGSFNTGSVDANGVKNDGSIAGLTTTSPQVRGFAVFDLSSIPPGSAVSAVSLEYTVESAPSISTGINTMKVFSFTSSTNPATATGLSLYNTIGSATTAVMAAWPGGTMTNAFSSAAAIDTVAAAAGGKVVIGWIRSSTFVYSFYGYPGTAAQQPKLIVTYIPSTPCTTPPTAGTAVATPSMNICPGSSVGLSLSGNSIGAGLSYTWQESTTGSPGTYTNIAGSTSPSPNYNFTILTSSYYRAVATCSGVSDTSTAVLVTVNGLFPGGTYTINNQAPTAGTNYNTFTEAIAALQCGIAGPVVFNVNPAIAYNEQVTIPQLFGTSATNTITINGNGASLSFNSTNTSNRAGITLDGADYININGLGITATGTTTSEYGWGIFLTNDADFNTITGCFISVDAVLSSLNYAGIVISGSATSPTTLGSNCDNNTITGNQINGGYYGITCTGTASPTFSGGNIIQNNFVQNFYLGGIYVNGQNGSLFSGNDISRPTRSAISSFYGVYMSGVSQSCVVDANRIHGNATAAPGNTNVAYCMYITGVDAPAGFENTFSNNAIYDITGEGTQYGIYSTSSDGGKYYHNTISLDDQTATSTAITRGVYQTTAATGLEFKNNIITVRRTATGAKYAVYLGTSTSSIVSDYNDYVVNPASATSYIGYLGGNQATLADLQLASGQEANSVSIVPFYNAPAFGDFSPTNASLDNLGTPLGIASDINGAPRSPSAPDMGAYEFTISGCVAPPTAGNAAATPSAVCTGDPVLLTLTGNSIGTGQTYVWESSTSAAGPFTAISSASANSDLTINPTATMFYRAAVTCSGNTAYSNVIQVVINPPLTGTFTINNNAPTGGTNFNNFADAIDAIKCGLGGAVVFNVDPFSNPYNEQINIPSLANASATNTVTINGNGAVVNFLSNNSSLRAGLTLNGADYVTVNDLEFASQPGAIYGWGALLTNDADYNTINGCTFVLDTASTSSNFAGIVMSGSATSVTTASNCDYNTITNNTIRGGYYAMSSYGGSTAPVFGNVFQNNVAENFYYSGGYFAYNNGLVYEGNDLSRAQRTTSTTTYMTYFTTGNVSMQVSKNRIHNNSGANVASTSTLYGMYILSDAPVGSENVFSNNLLYDFNSSGTIYGLYLSSPDNSKFYHNTIAIDDATTTASNIIRGIYMLSTGANMVLENNIVTLRQGGSGIKHAAYFGSTSGFISNYNDYLVDASDPNSYIGYSGGNRATLADLQTASGQEANSVSINPVYASPASGDFTPQSPGLNDLGLFVGIGDDITGAPRSASTPDMGAYEFSVGACVAPPTAGTANASSAVVCINTDVTLTVTGNSFGLGQTYVWQSSPTLAGTYTDISAPSSTSSYVANVPGDLYFRVAVTCSGMTTFSTPVFVGTNPALAAGTYTINSAAPTGGTNYNTFADAVAAMTCGITGAVVLNVNPGNGPYVEQVVIPSIPNLSAINNITINGNGAQLNFASTNTNARAVLTLDGSDYITIDNLMVSPTAAGTSTYGYGIQLINDADHNMISNCTVSIDLSVTSSLYAGIGIGGTSASITGTGSSADSNMIINNTVIGGYYGITAYGTSGASNLGNVIQGNTVEDVYAYSVYVAYNNDILISQNDISRPNRTAVTTFYGVYMTTDAIGKIDKNRIHNGYGNVTGNTSTTYAMYILADGTPTNFGTVSNNLIYDINNNGAVYGLYVPTADYYNFYHNTIVLDDATSTATGITRGIYVTNTSTTNDIKNNIIVIGRGGSGIKHGLYIGSTNSGITADYNDYYITSTAGSNYAAYYPSANYNTVADFNLGTGLEANGVSINPNFLNPSTGNYTPQAASLDNLGTFVGIADDVNGNPRSVTTPDIGAYEFSVGSCSAPPTAGTANASSSAVCVNTPVTLTVTGNSFGLGQTYVWQSSPTIAGTYTDISAPAATSSYVATVTGDSYFRVAVTCSGMTTFSTPVFVAATPALAGGTYTINSAAPTGGTNYQTFADAVSAMSCGVNGAVTFNVNPGSGPYVEQVVIPAIPNLSATNSITINGNGAQLNFASTNTSARAVLTLDGSDYVTIDNLVVSPTAVSGSTYGYGIQLINDADHNTISNCTVSIDLTVTSSFYAGIGVGGSSASVTTSGSSADSNVIINNTVIGGYYGITAYGTSGAANLGNVIQGNIVEDAYVYSIYAVYNNDLTVRQNDISRPNRPAVSSFYGVYLSTDAVGVVDKNRIHNAFGSVTGSSSLAYCIYVSGDAALGNAGIVSNNLIYDIVSNGTIYGIYAATADYYNFYHNTIVLDDATATTGTTRGIYITNTLTANDIKNNIIVIGRGGSGTKHGLYIGSTNAAITADYNDYYITSTAGSNYVGYYPSSNYNTVADFNLGTGLEANGKMIDPMFVSPATGDYTPNSLALDNQGTNVGIPDDILSVARSASTPDIGAYEFTAVPLSVNLLSFNASLAKSDVRTEWIAASEKNAASYIVERSENVTFFEAIGTVKAIGNSNDPLTYNFTDLNIANISKSNTLYYRLKMLDLDGTFEYSKIATVSLKHTATTNFEVYPNPFKDAVAITLSAIAEGNATIRISDVTGRILRVENRNVQSGTNHVTIDGLNGFAAGAYYISVEVDGNVQTARMIK